MPRYDPEFAETPVHLHKVSADAMERVIEYCSFHLAPGHSVKERKNFNKQFMRMDTARLCELASASHYLDLKSLIDLTCRALAKHIQGKNPEEIRETFNLPDDLTEEEKVAPIEFGMEDSRVRMLNSLYARKRKELAEAKRLENSQDQLENRVQNDDRDVDDLLSFIEGGGGGKTGGAGNPKANGGQGSEVSAAKSSGASERKRKKKERERAKKKERAEQQAKLEAERLAAEKAQLEADRAAAARRKALKQNVAERQQPGGGKGGSCGGGSKGSSKKRSGANKGTKMTSEREKSRNSGTADAAGSPTPVSASSTSTGVDVWSANTDATDSRLSVDLDSDDISDEDELDPDLRAAQDREVEEFARRLNGSLDDLAGQQASANGSVSHADMFAAFVTNMQPTPGAGDAVPAVQTGGEPMVAKTEVTRKPEAAPESLQDLSKMAERLTAETKRIQLLVADATRLEAAARQRWTKGAGPAVFDLEDARAGRAATAPVSIPSGGAVHPAPPLAPPPHDFRQKLASSIQRSAHENASNSNSSSGAGPSIHSWEPPRRVVTAVWAPPPLFEAADAIPGVSKGYCAVSYCMATLTVPGVKLTDVCSASFTGLGQAHAQLSAHVSDVDEVTVILRGIDDDPSTNTVHDGATGANGLHQRIQPTAGQLTVVVVDYLATERVASTHAERQNMTGDIRRRHGSCVDQ